LKPWLKKMWCIPPQQNAAFVCQMEQVLDVYKRPYDPQFPVVGMDEQHKQLIAELRAPEKMESRRPQKIDSEYVREGSCVVWMFFEPLGGWRDLCVTATRTIVDWAHQMQALVNAPRFAAAQRITVICDNLNTHALSSLYQAFPAAEASRIAKKLELVYTPKHGSWLNVAESELSVLTRQCLSRRIPSEQEVRREATQWAADRNRMATKTNWQFTTDKARVKLKHLYPKF
jgi:hypothetical protein